MSLLFNIEFDAADGTRVQVQAAVGFKMSWRSRTWAG